MSYDYKEESEYKIRLSDGHVIECNCCDQEVETAKFPDYSKQGWELGERKILCEYCANAFGDRDRPMSKAATGAMFNILEKRLKEYYDRASQQSTAKN